MNPTPSHAIVCAVCGRAGHAANVCPDRPAGASIH